MEKYESQIYRGELASKIIDKRKNEGSEASKSLLDHERENPFYGASKILKELKRELPNEYIEYFHECLNTKDTDSITKAFEISDISKKISPKQRLVIESEILENLYYHYYYSKNERLPGNIENKLQIVREMVFPNETYSDGKWGIKSGPDIFNDVCDGELYNNHNFAHVVGGQKNGALDFLIKPIDYESAVVSGHELYVSVSDYTYASMLDKSLVLMSPRCLKTRKFVESLIDMEYVIYYLREETCPSNLKINKNTDSLGNLYIGYGDPEYAVNAPLAYIMFFLADLPMVANGNGIPLKITGKNFTWTDISSTIINLTAGKTYKRKQTSDENNEVEQSIQFYRELIKNEFGINYEADMHKHPSQD